MGLTRGHLMLRRIGRCKWVGAVMIVDKIGESSRRGQASQGHRSIDLTLTTLQKNSSSLLVGRTRGSSNRDCCKSSCSVQGPVG